MILIPISKNRLRPLSNQFDKKRMFSYKKAVITGGIHEDLGLNTTGDISQKNVNKEKNNVSESESNEESDDAMNISETQLENVELIEYIEVQDDDSTNLLKPLTIAVPSSDESNLYFNNTSNKDTLNNTSNNKIFESKNSSTTIPSPFIGNHKSTHNFFSSSSSLQSSSSSFCSSPTPFSTSSGISSIKKKTLTSPLKKKSKKGSANISKFIDYVTKEAKNEIDLVVAKFFFGCNIPFAVIDSQHFIEMMKVIRPGYVPPCRQTLSTTLLDQVHSTLTEKTAENFPGVRFFTRIVCYILKNNTP